DAAFFRLPSVVEARDQLVVVARGGEEGGGISYPDFKVMCERNETLSGLAIHSFPLQISLGAGVRSEVVLCPLVSANYFDVLGIKPAIGRMFLPEEEQTPDSHPVVVLSHSFWQSRFNGDPALVGKTIVLNNRRFTVVGVAAAGFDGQSAPLK